MKTLFTNLFFCCFLFISYSAAAQFKVLFVDDSDDTFGNAELFSAAIDSAGYDVTYFNAVDSAVSPSDLLMKDYELVVWMTSTDGTGLQLWNGIDEDNASIKAYLNGGGKLWIVGNDFLFDKYGAPPYTFTEGEFMHDYAGILSYDAQSYGSDGNIGVSGAVAAANADIAGLKDLSWQFATLWWADAVTLTEGSSPVYLMGGDAAYPLKDKIMASLNSNDTFEVLTYFFDISLVNSFANLTASIKPIMVHFEGILSSVNQPFLNDQNLEIYPNPVNNNQFSFHIDLSKSTTINANLYNSQGKLIQNIFNNKSTVNLRNENTVNLDNNIGNGLYFLNVNLDGNQHVTKPILILKAN